jgi:Carbohydrate-selective porin
MGNISCFRRMVIIMAMGFLMTGAAILAQGAEGGSSPTEPGLKTSSDTPEPASYLEDFLTREKLTGDWRGVREELAKKGITLDVDLTQVLQGNVSGGNRFQKNPQDPWGGEPENHTLYQGHTSYTLNLDFQKLGLWPGAFLTITGETQYGNSFNPYAGTMVSVNSNALFPYPTEEKSHLTEVTFAQFLSQTFGVRIGKLTTRLGDRNPFAYDEKTTFLNCGFLYNPVFFRTCPYSALGVGFIWLPTPAVTFSFNAMDTEWLPNTSGFDTIFHNGTTLVSELDVKTNFFGKPGGQVFGGSWSNKTFTSLQQDPRIIISNIILGTPLATNKNSWCVFYNFHQYFFFREGTKDQGIGIFGRFGVGEAITNPMNYHIAFGIGGKGMSACRPDDRFGIGYYYTRLSDDLPRVLFSRGIIQNYEAGGEIFYNIALTPWLQMTPSVQVIESGIQKNNSMATVLSLRTQIYF